MDGYNCTYFDEKIKQLCKITVWRCVATYARGSWDTFLYPREALRVRRNFLVLKSTVLYNLDVRVWMVINERDHVNGLKVRYCK